MLLADLNISDERFVDAKAAALKAVAENPRDEDALARLAASCRLLVDPVGAAAAELTALANNPRPATFYAALGERLADRRKYHSAERAFLLAAAADPNRAEAPIGLGMLYMQVGRETEAKSLFDTAFAADPFNVRADNMMKVLAAHGVVHQHRFVAFQRRGRPDAGRAAGPLHVEISRVGVPGARRRDSDTHRRAGPRSRSSRTTSGSAAARSGCRSCRPSAPAPAGWSRLPARAATRIPFNWARVLTHEVVHVITLQQTEFNIPHWYTEALAVESEGFPRPQDWNRLLARAGSQANEAA